MRRFLETIGGEDTFSKTALAVSSLILAASTTVTAAFLERGAEHQNPCQYNPNAIASWVSAPICRITNRLLFHDS
jgi:hypothetical protein